MRWFEDLYNRPIYLELYQETDTHLAVQEVEGIETLLELKPGQTVLDVCCGYGHMRSNWGKEAIRLPGSTSHPRRSLKVSGELAQPR